MPVRTSLLPSKHSYLVVLTHNGIELDAALAPNAKRALRIALLMLAKRDDFRAGDVLHCLLTEPVGENARPLPKRD